MPNVKHPPITEGQRFGKLVIMRKDTETKTPIGNTRWFRTRWWVRCDCGRVVSVQTSNLQANYLQSEIRTGTRSCRNSDCMGAVRHGHARKKSGSKSRTYYTWVSMLSRCSNANLAEYKYYGGRGISVCKRWRTFENFLHDMGERPEDKTIDRIDVNKNYCKSNCRWATKSQQSNNTRKTIRITYENRTLTLQQWAEIKKINVNAIRARHMKGWPVEDVLHAGHFVSGSLSLKVGRKPRQKG